MRPLVVVDGENVRRSLWPNLSQSELVERARRWAEQEEKDLLVVFDGPAPEDAPDVLGTPYADDEIVSIATKAGRPVWVATSDRELRRRLEGSVERLIGGGSFARLL